MSVIYTTAVKQARMTAVVTAIGSAGLLVLYKADGTSVLATFTLATPAGDTASSPGVINLNDQNGGAVGVLSTTASGTGSAALAKIQTSAGVDIITGLTVGTATADIILDNVALIPGQAITITTGAITHA